MNSVHFAGRFNQIPVSPKTSRPGVIDIGSLESKVRDVAKKNGVQAQIEYIEKKDTLNIGSNGEDRQTFSPDVAGDSRFVNVIFNEAPTKGQQPERTKTDQADWDFSLSMLSNDREPYHYGHWSPTEGNNFNNFKIAPYHLLEGNLRWARKTLD